MRHHAHKNNQPTFTGRLNYSLLYFFSSFTFRSREVKSHFKGYYSRFLYLYYWCALSSCQDHIHYHLKSPIWPPSKMIYGIQCATNIGDLIQYSVNFIPWQLLICRRKNFLRFYSDKLPEIEWLTGVFCKCNEIGYCWFRHFLGITTLKSGAALASGSWACGWQRASGSWSPPPLCRWNRCRKLWDLAHSPTSSSRLSRSKAFRQVNGANWMPDPVLLGPPRSSARQRRVGSVKS